MRNCLGRSGEHRKGRRDRPQCWWAAGPGRTTSRRTGPHPAAQAPPVWRVPEGPVGTAAVPVGGGRSSGPGRGAGGRWRGLAGATTQTPRPIGSRREACGAWPDNESTRRAKLAARTASGRAGRAAAGDLSGQRARPHVRRRHEQRKRAAAHRAAARSRSQCNTQRSRAATTSATWTAFRAAPLRRLSPETTRTRPRLPSTA